MIRVFVLTKHAIDISGLRRNLVGSLNALGVRDDLSQAGPAVNSMVDLGTATRGPAMSHLVSVMMPCYNARERFPGHCRR